MVKRDITQLTNSAKKPTRMKHMIISQLELFRRMPHLSQYLFSHIYHTTNVD